MEKLTWAGFGLRLLFAALLVFLSYNPSGYSYFHWFDFQALQMFCGVGLVIAWAIYLRATLRSIGGIGLGLLSALLACLIWLLVDLGLLAMNEVGVVTWVIEIGLAIVLGVGMSWSLVRRRISGQVDTDDIDD